MRMVGVSWQVSKLPENSECVFQSYFGSENDFVYVLLVEHVLLLTVSTTSHSASVFSDSKDTSVAFHSIHLPDFYKR